MGVYGGLEKEMKNGGTDLSVMYETTFNKSNK